MDPTGQSACRVQRRKTSSRIPHSAAIERAGRAAFQISHHSVAPPHCLNAQEDTSSYAIQLYPRSIEKMNLPSTSFGELAFHLSVAEIYLSMTQEAIAIPAPPYWSSQPEPAP